jgi:hypothetical protein
MLSADISFCCKLKSYEFNGTAPLIYFTQPVKDMLQMLISSVSANVHLFSKTTYAILFADDKSVHIFLHVPAPDERQEH